jgi:hypothetical protein
MVSSQKGGDKDGKKFMRRVAGIQVEIWITG